MKKYLVNRGIQKDSAWRFEAGDVVTARQIAGAPIAHWLESGVLDIWEADDDSQNAED